MPINSWDFTQFIQFLWNLLFALFGFRRLV